MALPIKFGIPQTGTVIQVRLIDSDMNYIHNTIITIIQTMRCYTLELVHPTTHSNDTSPKY
ncbi:hypothetical protein [Leptolyngbya sp. AN02str]|uniref:hypothetical protein n=1 Tax=Leptolyngbya sp. AN02str TaxID=3423363 RepID=UPI003D31F726